MLISDLWFQPFLKQLFEVSGVTEYEIVDGYTYASCNKNYPSIYFLVNGVWLEVPDADYVREVESGRVCRLNIRAIDAPFHILGLPIFYDYYVTHNYGEGSAGSMSFGLHRHSIKSEPVKGTRPEKVLLISKATMGEEEAEALALRISIVVCVVLIAVLVYLLIRLNNDSTRSRESVLWIGILGIAGVAIPFFLLWVGLR